VLKRVCGICFLVFVVLTARAFPASLTEQEIQARVDALLVRMTVEEKIGQLTQIGGMAFVPGAPKPEDAIRRGGGGLRSVGRLPFHGCASRHVPDHSITKGNLDMIRYLVFLFALIVPGSVAASDEVKVDTGKLKGATQDGVASFKGIPYAAPPVGDLRWRPPQSAAPWNGVRPATAFGADCMQRPFPGDAAPLGVAPAEDCLYVNVWVPVKKPSKRLPVMVWFYGGGFVNGGSSPAVYDGVSSPAAEWFLSASTIASAASVFSHIRHCRKRIPPSRMLITAIWTRSPL
jgi:hypothetical protein